MMKPKKSNKIWAIGHSTHEIEVFTAMLKSFKIDEVVDIRSLPGSRKYPQFNQDALAEALSEHNITYLHLKDLGGRRKALPDSDNDAWRSKSFMGYADYMATDKFMEAIEHLKELAQEKRVAYMCAEAVWWRCHRALVSDYLKNKGWEVIHIFSAAKSQIHPYTSPATIVNGKLCYAKPSEKSQIDK